MILLGINGSAAASVLFVVRQHKKEIHIDGMSFGDDTSKMLSLIREFKPKYVCLKNQKDYDKLVARKQFTKSCLFLGTKGLEEIAKVGTYPVVNCLSGWVGFYPTRGAILASKTVVLANKECIVLAGDYLFDLAEKNSSKLLSIDTEINALQILSTESSTDYKGYLISTSGGSLRDIDRSEFANIPKEKVLNHPTWKMGKKITIESAIMLNKAYEVIEVSKFFRVKQDVIKVFVDPTATCHAMMQINDTLFGSIMYPPSMIVPAAQVIARDMSLIKMEVTEHAIDKYAMLDETKYNLVTLARKCLDAGPSATMFLVLTGDFMVDKYMKDKLNLDQLINYINEIVLEYISNLEYLKIPNWEKIEEEIDIRMNYIVKWYNLKRKGEK